VTGLAEVHIAGLIFHQQIGLGRTVRLVAGQTVHRGLYFARRRIHQVLHWMLLGRMAQTCLDGKHGHGAEIIRR